jgi:Transmembrane family 220, helix
MGRGRVGLAAEQPRLIRRLAAAAFAVLFAYATVVQYNDPDPIRWMALYAAACALCVRLALGRPPPAALRFGLAIVAAGWALVWAPGVVAAAAFTGTEEERELGGLLLVTLAALVLPAGARRGGSAAAEWGSVERGAGDGPAPRKGGE